MLDSQSSRKIVVAAGLAVVFGALIFEFVVPTLHVDRVAQSRPAPAVPPPRAAPTGNPTEPTPAAPTSSNPAPAQTAATQTQSTNQTLVPLSSPGPATAATAPQVAAGPAVASDQPAASDSQITADVKSQIAAASPESNVDVTTTNGVVVLAGSASSQDAADRARQAALRVAGVKNVDVSALKVSNLR